MIDEPLTPASPSVDAAAGVEDSEPGPLAFPPPGPPVLVSEIGIGIERKRREARSAWEKKYGSRGRGSDT